MVVCIGAERYQEGNAANQEEQVVSGSLLWLISKEERIHELPVFVEEACGPSSFEGIEDSGLLEIYLSGAFY